MINLATLKIYLVIGGIVILVISGLTYSLKNAIKKNAELHIAVNQAAETIVFQSNERVKIENINLASKKRLEELQSETSKLQSDLQKQKLSEQQKTCDATPTPDGYTKRMLEYALGQTRDFKTR